MLGLCLTALSRRLSKKGLFLKLRAQDEKASGTIQQAHPSHLRKEGASLDMEPLGCSLQACWGGSGRLTAQGTLPR